MPSRERETRVQHPIALGIDLGAEISRVDAVLHEENGPYVKMLGEADGVDEVRSTFSARSQTEYSVGHCYLEENPSNLVYGE